MMYTLIRLRKRLSKSRPTTERTMKKTDWPLCKTHKKRMGLCVKPTKKMMQFRNHIRQLYSRKPVFDQLVLEMLEQYPVTSDSDHVSTDTEI